jgi:hypothetical protein
MAVPSPREKFLAERPSEVADTHGFLGHLSLLPVRAYVKIGFTHAFGVVN